MMTLAADHLWQSTLFTGVMALLGFAFRGVRADVRYWLWLAASVKFLLPFAALIAIGTAIGWRAELGAVPDLTVAVSTVSQPFTSTAVDVVRMADSPADEPLAPSLQRVLLAIWIAGTVLVGAGWLRRWRAVSGAVRAGTTVLGGRELDALRRSEAAAGIRRGIRLVESAGALEPGVYGLFRPVLLWPRRISDRLTDAQVEAVIAHEVAHVRRRDNLASLAHMVVQAVFWFHPLVWWLSARLVDERERACDQDVVRRGSAPDVYAESILATVRSCVESPVACVSGVTGSDLKKRIERIMNDDRGARLGAARTMLLAGAALASFAGPLAVGVISAPQLTAPDMVSDQTPRFAVTSVKPNTSGMSGGTSRNLPDGFTATNFTLWRLTRNAYGLQDPQLIGGPDWFNTDHFDVEAKLEATAPTTPAVRQQMMRALLHDRFKLRAHTETREVPVYGIVFARADRSLGPTIKPGNEADCAKPEAAPVMAPPGGRGRGGPLGCGATQFGPGGIIARGITIQRLAENLSGLPGLTNIDRIVLDRTGLTGTYDFELKWTTRPPGVPPGPGAPPAAAALDDVSSFTALQDQLGLKLEPQRAPLPVLVIDSAERPEPN
jgi:bla regulator protein blaR1